MESIPQHADRLLGLLLTAALALGTATHVRAERPPPAAAAHERDATVDRLVRDAWHAHQQQRYTPALAHLQRAERIAPARADVQFLLGEVLFWLKRTAAAREHYERAVLLEPILAPAYAGIGESCYLLAKQASNHPRTRHAFLVRAQRAFAIAALLDPNGGKRASAKQTAAELAPPEHPLDRLERWIAALLLALGAAIAYRLRSQLRPAQLGAALRRLRATLFTFALSRALVLGAIAIAPAVLAESPEHPVALLRHSQFVLDTAAGRWDSNLYVDVADTGYRVLGERGPDDWGLVGEFPLLPVLYRWLGWLFDDKHVAALVLPNVALLLAAVLLFGVFEREHGARLAFGATSVLLLHPGSLYGSVLYTEPLALLGLAGIVFCVQRQAYLEAGLWGVFAGLARINALAIVPWLLFDALRARGRARLGRVWAVFGLLLGVGLFMLYLQLELGDWLAYFRELRAMRFANKGSLVAVGELIDLLGHLVVPGTPRGGPVLALLLALACLLAYLAVLAAQLRARAFGPALFVATGLALGLTSSLCAQPRYLWLLFPAAPWIARALDRRGLRHAAAAAAAAVLAVAAIAFSRWYYVT